ncbi:MAG: glutaminyl-peptide cyclotransferase [Phycisphaerae bacterium]|nr:glutaminyl-peptide cyclotransferase [Phycisphaerae bacterium]
MRPSLNGRCTTLRVVGLAILAGITGSCDRRGDSPSVPTYRCEVVRVLPHRPDAFTQGLAWAGGFLYEGTGLYGRSVLTKARIETGEILQRVSLPASLFGEGVTVLKDRIYQLTWQEGVALVYDRETFDLVQRHRYSMEGWGLTHDGDRLILSDGTDTLYFLDPNSFQTLGTVQVCDDRGPVSHLNELEFIRGKVYANVWQTERIAVINPVNGRIDAWLDLAGLWAQQPPGADVPNGIAYDPQADRLFVTGKLWPRLYEIRPTQPKAP